jgi:hypothetical protein
VEATMANQKYVAPSHPHGLLCNSQHLVCGKSEVPLYLLFLVVHPARGFPSQCLCFPPLCCPIPAANRVVESCVCVMDWFLREVHWKPYMEVGMYSGARQLPRGMLLSFLSSD